jgi:hypothetical protein
MAKFQNSFNIRKCKNLPLLILISLLLVSPVLADNTVKTVNLYGGFVASASADTPYSKDFTFVSPDGLEKVYYVKSTFFADNPNSQTTRFYVKLDDQYCNPNYYDIPANAERYQMDFDCTDVFNGEKTYTGGFQANRNLNNVYGEWEVTYKNNPIVDVDDIYEVTKTEISVGATDYVVGDEALIHARVSENLIPVTDAFCDYEVFYPNRSFFRSNIMNFIPQSRGLYTDNFTIPNVTGVYPMEVVCVKPTENFNQTRYFVSPTSETYEFKNDTLVGDKYLLFSNIEPDQAEVCHPQRFTELASDYENGEFRDFRNLGSIFNITGWWTQDGGSAEYELVYKFYKVTLFGNIYIGSVVHNTETEGNDVDTSIQEYVYSNLHPQITWLSTDLLQAEVCARKIDGGSVDLYYYYNSDNYPSRFTLKTIGVNATTLDFEIGSSSELNVKYIGGSQQDLLENISYVETVGNVETIDSDRLEYAGATEYLAGTEGQLLYQYITIQAGNQVPINDADWCNATVWYPNSTLFLDNQNMPYFTGSNGLYYTNFTIPDNDGVFKVDVTCFRSPKYSYSSSTFHVENSIYEDTQQIQTNQQQVFNFVQDMNITMVTNQEYMKGKIDDIWDYVNEMINNIYSIIIS